MLEAARKARAEVEAQLAEKDPEAVGLDASGRRLLSQNRAMAKELELHIEVCLCCTCINASALQLCAYALTHDICQAHWTRNPGAEGCSEDCAFTQRKKPGCFPGQDITISAGAIQALSVQCSNECAAMLQEAEALQTEVKLLQAETGQLRRDNELKSEVEAQCARRGAAQVRHPKLLLDPSITFSHSIIG